ncbi:hypothetical protein SARC_16608, partial [Sphaeroforma arctica JP610]
EESSRPCANRDSNTTAGHGAENSVNGNVVMEPGLYGMGVCSSSCYTTLVWLRMSAEAPTPRAPTQRPKVTSTPT